MHDVGQGDDKNDENLEEHPEKLSGKRQGARKLGPGSWKGAQ